ncbi:MAG: HEAT repeat domain-containing protein [Phycisphaeraceae bacterium]
MTSTQDLFARLKKETDPSVAAAVAAALPTADPAALRLGVQYLLERGSAAHGVILILHYHRLGFDLQRAVARHLVQTVGPLRQAIYHTDPHAAPNVLRIIRDSLSPDLGYLAVELLQSGPSDLWPEAARCLLELTHINQSLEGDSDYPGHPVQQSVREALAAFAHHKQPAVVLAWMWLSPRPLAPLAPTHALADERSPLVVAARYLLQGGRHRAARRAAISLLAIPHLTGAALQGLGRCTPQQGLTDVLCSAHLVLHPGIASSLARLPQAHRLLPGAAHVGGYAPAGVRALPGWIMALPVPAGDRVRALAVVGKAADDLARLSALRALLMLSHQCMMPASGPTVSPADAGAIHQAIAAFCHDNDPVIARLALRQLILARCAGLPRLLAWLTNSPHEMVRRLASQQLAPLGFARLWDAWPRLDEERRLAAGRALIKLDSTFARHLGERLGQDSATALRAMSIIQTLNQAPLFEEALRALSAADDVKVAATAVRALGAVSTPPAIAALEAALAHADSRVRANAVEALEQAHSTRHIKRLLEMAAHDAGRPRANAIKVLLSMRTRDAFAALGHMLMDGDAAQRTSALWLVETAGLFAVARQVAEMSITDPDATVQRRADRVIHGLIQAMRARPAVEIPA